MHSPLYIIMLLRLAGRVLIKAGLLINNAYNNSKLRRFKIFSSILSIISMNLICQIWMFLRITMIVRGNISRIMSLQDKIILLVIPHSNQTVVPYRQTANYAQTCLGTTTESPHQKLMLTHKIIHLIISLCRMDKCEDLTTTHLEISSIRLTIMAKHHSHTLRITEAISFSQTKTSKLTWARSGRPSWGSRSYSSSICRSTQCPWVCRRLSISRGSRPTWTRDIRNSLTGNRLNNRKERKSWRSTMQN